MITPTLFVVVPCYNEEKTLPSSLPVFRNMLSSLMEQGKVSPESHLLFVNDGSSDGTLDELKELSSQDKKCLFVSLSRNFGKESAIYAGLEYSKKADFVCIMDCDLQDPPSLLPLMLESALQEGFDHVATRRVSRKGEPPIRSFFARMFYRLINRISSVNIVDGARDYRLMSRKFADALISLGEYNRFSKGLFGWVGFKTRWIEFENVERVAGETKWSFWKLFKYSVEGIVSFSAVPLSVSSFLGVLLFFVSLVMTTFVVVRRIFFGDPVDGWASTMSVILLLGGIQLLCIGILGQYLSRTYLEAKRRPVFIVEEENVSNL